MDWKNLLVKPDIDVKTALKKMDQGGLKIVFVTDKNNVLLGVMTDGDIRRHILNNCNLSDKIDGIYNKNAIYFSEDFSICEAKELMSKNKIEVIPIVDKNKNITDVVVWTDLIEKEDRCTFLGKIDLPVVIMAGGRGSRLDPFTKILPKPLIPIDELPIIEVIINKFYDQGVKNFYVTLNYKGEMIKIYFDGILKDYNVNYIWENEYLGTAGSLQLLPDDFADTFIVSNCDIVVDLAYKDLIDFHEKNNNLITVVGSIQHYKIPYGIIKFEKAGKIKKIQEKPELDFTVNTGVYVLSKNVLNFIPKDKSIDMTELIQLVLDSEKPVGVYPISQKSYSDIGEWKEFKQTLEKLNLNNHSLTGVR